MATMVAVTVVLVVTPSGGGDKGRRGGVYRNAGDYGSGGNNEGSIAGGSVDSGNGGDNDSGGNNTKCHCQM